MTPPTLAPDPGTAMPHVLPTYARGPQVFTHGEGCRLFTADGTAWLDMLGGIAVSALGHAHPALVAALQDQAARLLHVSNLYGHPLLEPVAARLARATDLPRWFFANSGAEANDGALKLARAWQRDRGAGHRVRFLAMEHGFHGRTMGTVSVTSTAAYRQPFEPLIPEVEFLPPGDRDALDAALAREPAALILEPIQGEGGIRPLCHGYLRFVRERCSASGTVLIHDEVQCGVGRTGTFLAAHAAGVTPDVVTLAKPLGAGLPIGAIGVAAPFGDALRPGRHGSTFGGGAMALRAALTVLEQLQDHGLSARVAQLGAHLEQRLWQLAAAHRDRIAAVRGRGLMQGIVCRDPGDAPALVAGLHARHVLTCAAAGGVVRFLPPYVITETELDLACDRLADTLTSPTTP